MHRRLGWVRWIVCFPQGRIWNWKVGVQNFMRFGINLKYIKYAYFCRIWGYEKMGEDRGSRSCKLGYIISVKLGKNGAVKCVPKNILQRIFWIQTKLALTNLQEHKKFTDDRLIQSAIQYLHNIDFIWLIWIYKAKIKTPWISLHYNYMNCTKDKHVARHFLSFQ